MTIYTIGHSTHPIAVFIAMLQSFGIRQVADIRLLPGSNRYPQFNQDALRQSLKEAGIYIPGSSKAGRAILRKRRGRVKF